MRVLNIYEEFVRKLSLKKSNVSLVDYMIYFSQRKEELGRSNSRSQTIKSTIRHIVNFSPKSIPLNKVDKEFCIGFIKYLKEYNKNNKHLSIDGGWANQPLEWALNEEKGAEGWNEGLSNYK
jgi:hypothetical protein